MEKNSEVEISFDLQHVEKRHREVVDMINKIDKKMKVMVNITNVGEKFIDVIEDVCETEDKLYIFDADNTIPIKRGFYDVIQLTNVDVLDIKDLLDSNNIFLTNKKFVIKCKLCELTFTRENDFKCHNMSKKHYMKYAENFCQRRNMKKNQEIANKNLGKENLGKIIFDILKPIIHQIYKLDIAGKILLQPGVDGLEPTKERFEEILFDIFISSTEIFHDTNCDSGFDI